LDYPTDNATHFWWIRHAPVPQLADRIYGNTDPECDVSDRAAFARLAERLPREAVWTISHLQRTRQTAQAIAAEGYALPELIVEPSIGEQDFGALHGVLHAEHAARRDDAFQGFWPLDPEQPAPGGESLADVRNRVGTAVDRLASDHAGRDIVCVSHGGAILSAVSHALGLGLASAVSLSIPNLSLTRLSVLRAPRPGGPRWRVLGIGERPSP
jgi:broad specificity phosphatase PhoE